VYPLPDLTQLRGVLFFPVTPFDSRDRVDTDLLADHVRSRLDHAPAGIFPACGTGEFHALTVGEYRDVLDTTVRVSGGRVPVIGGTGGPLGHARQIAVEAEQSGADALLVLPPYLVGAPQAGLIAYVEALAAVTELPLIVYHRANAALTPATVEVLLRNPRIIGFKDGVGDIAVAQQFVLAAERSGRDDVVFFNGLLTAELSQAAYRAIGVPHYSSAVFAMAPTVANAFYAAYAEGDEGGQRKLLREFYAPLVQLRDEVPGFAVSLVKAGVRLEGLPVGPVRAPLVDPDPEQLERLRQLIDRGQDLAS
jgi:5-dehydro-4-deoxyglucarate dehydratase